MTRYPGTYRFSCSLGLEAILPILNNAGPWVWSFRDSDTEGFYLVTHAPPGKTKIKITGEGTDFQIDVFRYTDDPVAAPSELVHGIILKSLLPAVGATDVRAVE